MSLLFSPLPLKNVTLKNRMAVSSMCMYSCIDGYATDFHLVHLGNRALGGFGLIMQEGTAISPEGRITFWDLGIWKDEHIASLKRSVQFCQSHGAAVGIQLAHAGRKGSHLPPHKGRKALAPDHPNGWKTVSPSEIAYGNEEVLPTALDLKGIEKVKQDFVAATKRAKEVGYEVLEIHAAHGYLLHQFYSPLSNHRTDEYGGSFENRIRLLLEVTQLVKAVWGEEKPLFVRISATDWTDGGWSIEDSIELAKRLKALGVDLIDTSSGGNVRASIPTGPGYQVDFAAQIKAQAQIKTGAVGMITTAQQSEELLKKEQADLILYARKALRNPYFPLHAAHELKAHTDWPTPYLRGKEGM